MILENLKQAYLYKANYCSDNTKAYCLYKLTEEFKDTVYSNEFSSFSKYEKDDIINDFKNEISIENIVLAYKKAS